MTPDKQRDKVDMIFAKRPVHERVANVYNAAIGQVMARFCYTRREAEEAMRLFISGSRRNARKPRAPEAHQ